MQVLALTRKGVTDEARTLADTLEADSEDSTDKPHDAVYDRILGWFDSHESASTHHATGRAA